MIHDPHGPSAAPRGWGRPLRTGLRAAAALLLLATLAACGGGGAHGPRTFAVSGVVSHLDAAGLTLGDGVETLSVPQGATSFTFSTKVADGAAYAVSVVAQPAGETCAVTGGAGAVAGADVASVAVKCSTLISGPTTLGVVPAGSTASDNSRIFLPISAVGDAAVSINSILDTGSAGLILNAFLVFPSSMVTADGFVFPAGQDTLTYNGVTVTKAQFTKSFGGQTARPTQDTGNLGFAQLTFGAGTKVTTKVTPILFVWKLTADGAPAPAANIPNFFGVNAALNTLVAVQASANPGAGTPPPPCTTASVDSCGVASPLRYLTYASGVNAGFTLDRIALNACAVDTGACPVQNALTLGLNAAAGAGFSTVTLDCRMVTGGDFQDERFCSQVIAGVTVASGGQAFTGPAIFDSGVPMVRLTVPAGASFPAALPQGSDVQVTPPYGGAYGFTTGTGYLRTVVAQTTDAGDFSNLGIAFFTHDAFLLSYANGLEGWR